MANTGIGIDRQVNKINDLLANVGWIEERFDRVWLIQTATTRKIQKLPFTTSNGKDFDFFLQDDTITAFSGIVFGPETITDYMPTKTTWERERSIGIIVVARMDRIYPSHDYPYQEILKADVESQLCKMDGLLLKEYIDDNIELVFKGFDIRDFSPEVAVFPNAFLRWNGIIKYGGQNESCN